MALHTELPVYRASYAFLIRLFKTVKTFPREYKYTIGETLKRETLDCMMAVFRANSDKENRSTLLFEARKYVETIRILLRVCHDLRIVALEPFVSLNSDIEDISRQISGWMGKSGNRSTP